VTAALRCEPPTFAGSTGHRDPDEWPKHAHVTRLCHSSASLAKRARRPTPWRAFRPRLLTISRRPRRRLRPRRAAARLDYGEVTWQLSGDSCGRRRMKSVVRVMSTPENCLSLVVPVTDDVIAQIAVAVKLRLVADGWAPPGSGPDAVGEWLNTKQAAIHLGCSVQRIRALCCARRLAVYKEGTRSLFRRRDLDEIVIRAA
jgi:hypothetical protein